MVKLRLKDLCYEHRISKWQCATDLKIPGTLYLAYEAGIRFPSDEMLAKMAAYFCCSPDYLLCRTNDPDVYGVSPIEPENHEV